jgi:hypothetical protein
MANHSKLLLLLAALLISFSTAGCAAKYTAPPPSEAELGPPAASYRFEDLPVPATMSLVRGESYAIEAGGLRAAILVYEGKDDPAELVKYYRENMPQHNWKLASVFEREEATLIFRKPGWNCAVNIGKKTMQATRLTILFGPIEGEK